MITMIKDSEIWNAYSRVISSLPKSQMRTNMIEAVNVPSWEIVEAINYICRQYPKVNELMMKELFSELD